MRATRVLLQHRQPMIRFLGKRSTPSKIDHTPTVHPASSSSQLPTSFAQYRQQAQQHGPLGTQNKTNTYGYIGNHSGASLGPVEPTKGMYFDRKELPARFQRKTWSLQEIEAIESGGASVWN